MSIEFNDRGKYFTDIVSKTAVNAVIQTTTHRIEGAIHVRLDERVKDELDRAELFLPVTQAKVFAVDGTVLFQAEFMTISRSQIVWVIPSDDATGSKG
ncbi:MAG: hypothetical protein CO094_00490 [Anaerolineae bacterium CG_4_9_14_3_um_filter_57_17]|nr:hypothetical protein [bacterium]NCT20805.1 hypothetical protein [bacterium]OIO84155.1 MAG: hypothetical protein AUK01_10335 [Anaerolineae bacterium CG2_30_57_67]PJB68662.1 MAG: hypothetical protein CO094_00490 [Anaerolineae bacterium CG_4_9_14_3_um_filter_57_17]